MRTLAQIFGVSAAALGLVAAAGLAPNSLVAWSQVTTDVNGGPTVVVAYEMGVFIDQDDAPIRSVVKDANAYTGTATRLVVEGLPDGRYWVRVRAQSKWGVWSEWSVALEVIISTVAPVAPAGVKVK